MERLSHSDGSWEELLNQWSKQCHHFDEDFEGFMSATIPLLGDEIERCVSNESTGVYAHVGAEGEQEAICFLNGAYIPKFTGRVLRVRHLILAPKYDFDDYSEKQYAKLLADVFEDVLGVSDSSIRCPNVKFHFRSPADLALFREFSKHLNESERFSSVKMVGSWLFVSKA